MIEFDFKNKTKHRVLEKNLRKIVEKFSKVFYPSENIQISTTIVTKREIVNLNKKYFGKNKATDVISLESKSDLRPKSLGEMVICGDVAQKEAEARGHSLQKEIEILFCHGLVHLLGKDHDDKLGRKNWNKALFKLRKDL